MSNAMAWVHSVNARAAAGRAWEDDAMTDTPPATLAPADAERLALNGIDLLELYSLGEPARLLSGAEDAVESLALYAQLLEATLMVLYAAGNAPTTVDRVREAARETARAWRRRAP